MTDVNKENALNHLMGFVAEQTGLANFSDSDYKKRVGTVLKAPLYKELVDSYMKEEQVEVTYIFNYDFRLVLPKKTPSWETGTKKFIEDEQGLRKSLLQVREESMTVKGQVVSLNRIRPRKDHFRTYPTDLEDETNWAVVIEKHHYSDSSCSGPSSSSYSYYRLSSVHGELKIKQLNKFDHS